jgi:hypothetical protein
MTEQEIFNKAYLGLKSQDFELSLEIIPETQKVKCRYRAPDGNRCAIGWCIKDEDYNPTWEGSSVDGLPYERLFPGIDIEFLACLQREHDTTTHGKNEQEVLKTRLDRFARYHTLTIPKG